MQIVEYGIGSPLINAFPIALNRSKLLVENPDYVIEKWPSNVAEVEDYLEGVDGWSILN